MIGIASNIVFFSILCRKSEIHKHSDKFLYITTFMDMPYFHLNFLCCHVMYTLYSFIRIPTQYIIIMPIVLIFCLVFSDDCRFLSCSKIFIHLLYFTLEVLESGLRFLLDLPKLLL